MIESFFVHGRERIFFVFKNLRFLVGISLRRSDARVIGMKCIDPIIISITLIVALVSRSTPSAPHGTNITVEASTATFIAIATLTPDGINPREYPRVQSQCRVGDRHNAQCRAEYDARSFHGASELIHHSTIAIISIITVIVVVVLEFTAVVGIVIGIVGIAAVGIIGGGAIVVTQITTIPIQKNTPIAMITMITMMMTSLLLLHERIVIVILDKFRVLATVLSI
mmetsp:Transcript_11910/g.22640  ORF Transcript_11910/g.22640 Transcript_11910/m.22640 type:complete len:225 (-) Transcript_11910:85-759(-)